MVIVSSFKTLDLGADQSWDPKFMIASKFVKFVKLLPFQAKRVIMLRHHSAMNESRH